MGAFVNGETYYKKGVSGAWMWWDILLEKIGGEKVAKQIVLALFVLALARFWHVV